MSGSNNCIICDEKFNKQKHKPICCLYCDFTACRTCCETYVVDQKLPKCMNNDCGKEWTRQFMSENFTLIFRKTRWTRVLEDVAFDNETALLPATQGIVEQIKESERILKEIQEVDRMFSELRQRRRNLEIEYNNGGNVMTATERRQFVRACPEETCRGFLSTAWKCGLCDKYTCPDCHVVKGTRNDVEHVCNPEDLETAKLLDRDTKPCPKCGTGIFKIDGCDQMWCTQCHTAFSWRTCRIETHVHNPHYYEWQRRNNGGTAPRNIGDLVCGREIVQRTATDFVAHIREKTAVPSTNSEGRRKWAFPANGAAVCDTITLIVQSVIHLQRVQLPYYQVNHIEDNQKYRIQYLRNYISKEEFKNKIQRANKDHSKKREIGNVMHLFIETVTDIMYRVGETIQNANVFGNIDERSAVIKAIQNQLQEVNGILEYSNECLMHISQAYNNCTRKYIVLYKYNDTRRIIGNRDVLRTWHNNTSHFMTTQLTNGLIPLYETNNNSGTAMT